MEDYVIGLDIGSSKICAIAGKMDKNGNLSIVGVSTEESCGVKNGKVFNIDDASKSIESCIKQLEKIIERPITNVVVSVPQILSGIVRSKGEVVVTSKNKEITEEDIDRVKMNATKVTLPANTEILDVIPEQYIIDDLTNIKDPLRIEASKLALEAQLVVANTNTLNNLFKSINKLGIKVDDLVFQPLALKEAVLKREEYLNGTLILDCGGELINLSIFKDDTIQYLDTIPVGGKNITSDLSYCLQMPLKEAEDIKKKYFSVGKGIANEEEKITFENKEGKIFETSISYISQIMEARVDEMFYLVLNKLMENDLCDDINNVVIVGGGIGNFYGVEEKSAKILGKPSKIGYTEFVGASNPLLCTAIGIVKVKMKSIKEKILKESISDKAKTKSPKTYRDSFNKDELEIEDEDNMDETKGFFSKIKKVFTDFF